MKRRASGRPGRAAGRGPGGRRGGGGGNAKSENRRQTKRREIIKWGREER